MTDGEFKNKLLPCYRRMYATALSILRNADDASDAVQDTISIIWQKHDSMKIPDNPEAFCCKSVRNTCIDHLRQNAGKYYDNIDNLGYLESATTSDTSASFDSMRSYIAALLSGFKENHQRIIKLSIFSQLTCDEITEITGESAENVRTVLSRGRKKLKEYMQNELR